MLTVVKFLNGEEVIAKAVEQDGRVALVDPYLIDSRIDNNGKVKATLYPTALFSKDKTIYLNEAALMYTSFPTDEIAEIYEKQFQTILTPDSKIIV
jgi:hypothetical protein